jgi:hypothetical protein
LAFAEYARYGANRRLLLLGHLAALGALTAAVGMLLGVVSILGSRPIVDPELARDVLTSGVGGALGGASYAVFFTLAAGLWRHGAIAFLMLDWLLGAGVSLAAVAWPRSHLRNFLGGEPVMDWPQWTATPALLLLSFVVLLLAMARVPR